MIVNYSDQLAYWLNKKGITANALAKKSGVPQPTIHKILDGKTQNPGMDTMFKLSEALGISLFDLIEENGTSLSPVSTKVTAHSAPLISWVKAGQMTPIEDSDVEEWFLYPGKNSNPRIFCLRVSGESMEPKFQNGDIVFIDPDKGYDNGSIVVVVDNCQSEAYATMKKIVYDGPNRYLKPLNPEWPGPKFIPITETMSVVGVVIGKYVIE